MDHFTLKFNITRLSLFGSPLEKVNYKDRWVMIERARGFSFLYEKDSEWKGEQ